MSFPALHPYASGNIAAATREVRRLGEMLSEALRSSSSAETRRLVILATTHADMAAAHLDDAVTLDEMANEMEDA